MRNNHQEFGESHWLNIFQENEVKLQTNTVKTGIKRKVGEEQYITDGGIFIDIFAQVNVSYKHVEYSNLPWKRQSLLK